MSPEEPSLSTLSSSSGQPGLSRADVAIGSVSRHIIQRSVEPLALNRPPAASAIPVQATSFVPPQSQPQPSNQSVPVQTNLTVSEPTVALNDANEIRSPESTVPLVSTPDQSSTTNTQFTGQPKRRSLFKNLRVLIPAIGGAVVILFCGGIIGWIHWHGRRNSPEAVFRDALEASLMTTQLEEQTTSSNLYSLANYDFSNMTNPEVSTRSTINQNGSSFQLAGYGSAKNTYISYLKFPANISKNITSLATNGWVQLRSNGVLPSGVDAALDNIADPRYQDIGLLSFGDFSTTTRNELVNYLLSENIYDYNVNNVTHTTLNGERVIAYPINLNINFLKIYDQSLATDEGFSPSDVASAVNSLGDWSGAKATFYVSASTHRFVAVSLNQDNKTTNITFSNYNDDTLPQEPETNLNWQDFAPVQQMIETQAATHPTTTYGTLRKLNLAPLA